MKKLFLVAVCFFAISTYAAQVKFSEKTFRDSLSYDSLSGCRYITVNKLHTMENDTLLFQVTADTLREYSGSLFYVENGMKKSINFSFSHGKSFFLPVNKKILTGELVMAIHNPLDPFFVLILVIGALCVICMVKFGSEVSSW